VSGRQKPPTAWSGGRPGVGRGGKGGVAGVATRVVRLTSKKNIIPVSRKGESESEAEGASEGADGGDCFFSWGQRVSGTQTGKGKTDPCECSRTPSCSGKNVPEDGTKNVEIGWESSIVERGLRPNCDRAGGRCRI